MKHKSTVIPDDEFDGITDVDIFLLCKYSEASLLVLLLKKEEAWTAIASCQAMLTTTLSGKINSFLLHNFIVKMCHATESITGKATSENLQLNYEIL